MKSWKISPTIEKLISLIAKTAMPKKIVLFGSRARGNFRENSDIDLCVIGRTCNDDTWNKLLVSIQEDPHTLLKVDLVEFETLNHLYQNEITKDGVTVYESNP